MDSIRISFYCSLFCILITNGICLNLNETYAQESNTTLTPLIPTKIDETSTVEDDEEVNHTHIWTKPTSQNSNDSELFINDLNDENEEDSTIMTDFNDYRPCIQFNNKPGVCLETRKCLKRQPMHTKFKSCGEWPKRSLPLRVCCGFNIRDPDDNIYLRDATVNCGVSVTYDNDVEQQLEYTVQSVQNYSSDHNNDGGYDAEKNNFSQFFRILNGKKARLGQIPWFVGLYHSLIGHVCNAIIISRRHCLTAAHCFDRDLNPLHYQIRAGSLGYAEDTGKIYRISDFVQHKRYIRNNKFDRKSRFRKFKEFFDDIAVFKLFIDIKFSQNVSPICLPHRGMISRNLVGEIVHVSGFKSRLDNGGNLKEIQLSVIPNRYCYKRYTEISIYGLKRFRDTIVCADDLYGLKDACEGDSGGPLAYWHNGRWYLVGVVSYGLRCGWAPGVYTCVAPYLRWIKRKLH